MDNKKGFLLYPNYKEQIDMLNTEQKAELLDAIFNYQNGIDTGKLSGITAMAFSFIKSQFDRDSQAWEETKHKRSEAGKKSAEAKKEQKATNSTSVDFVEQDLTNSTSVEFVEHESTNSTVNVNVNVNDNVNDNVNETVNVIDDSACANSTEIKYDYVPSETPAEIMNLWNSIPGIVPITRMTSNKYNAILHICAIEGIETVKEGLEKIRGSDFLTGKNSDFKANIQWFCNPNNFEKLIDGNYDRNADKKPPSKVSKPNFTERKTDYSDNERRMLHAQLH